ncbi:MAG TPA: permease-like cell division protein FtsX [Candidatus Saccharimonadales bacterium]|nr:permease-like cell division protein FtsX [Candidatus Saccharimonadales bacterium]
MRWDRKVVTLERIVKNGFINFGRNIWLAIAAIAMMMITLTILLFAIVANATFNHTISQITSHIDVSVYLNDDFSQANRDKLMGELKRVDNVQSLSYVSKDQALKTYEADNAGNKDLLTAISETDNPLPASIKIQPVDPNKIQSIKDFLDKSPYASGFQYISYSGDQKTAIDNITKATHFFQQGGVVGIIVFMVISMLIIFNTIRMAIFNRRDELVIMRLLGASTAFIRGPFIVETMLYGAVAATVSLLLCAALFKVASSTLQASSLGLLDISYSNNFFTKHLLEILLGQIAIGILIGAASSYLATRRYLKLNR